MNLWETIKLALLSDVEFNPFIIGGCPVFKNKLFLSDKVYVMSKDQRTGEKEMISLSDIADNEDHWTYFKDTNYWFHSEIDHLSTHDPKEGRISMGYRSTRLKKSFTKKAGLGEDIVEYHLHPDRFIDLYLKHNPEDYKDLSREFYKTILLPYPSLTDLNNTREFPDREYKIASPLGITTYKLHKDELNEDNWLDLIRTCYLNSEPGQEEVDTFINPLAAPKEEVVTHAVVRTLNKALCDIVTLSFFPKSKL